ncbi:YrrS family protein [Bacillus thermotolerans]|uniref:YrrS family protein n=1 Tax=Bacillus thermotolerans TaxID=1221996 RepID=UPI000589321F|nr:YrrS family protein [Bacillus thermotolerans]KKB43562.1 hypothetical protein QY96_00799 [Bacillus thermotolerans]
MAQHTRAERKVKQRKTNRILNTAIAVVVLLIIVVAFTIFSGGQDESANQPEQQVENNSSTASQTEQADDEQSSEAPAEEEPSGDSSEDEAAVADEEENKEKEEENEDNQEEVIVKESDKANVEEEIVDPNWSPVGTSQSGNHTSSFDQGSVDWQEKEQALSYATGIPQENMTVWYISGNGPDSAIGTVSTKSNPDEAYRVFITWVDGEGWKPTKMYKLEHNDKR